MKIPSIVSGPRMTSSVHKVSQLRKGDWGVLIFGLAVMAYLIWGGHLELLAIGALTLGLYWRRRAFRKQVSQVNCWNCGFDLTGAGRSEKLACPRCGVGLES